MKIFEFPSRLATPQGIMSPHEVHVWRASLDVTATQRGGLLRNLSADEVVKAQRFHFEKDRVRFIAARGILREILGQYLQKEPCQLWFRYNAFGKPTLVNDESLTFNLSHSGEIVLIAIASGREVGIDVEQVRQDVAVGLIAERFFTQKEITELGKLPACSRVAMFFQYWTRKEAYVKAVGEGISFPLERCEVSIVRRNVSTPLIFSSDKRESSPWSIQDLYLGSGYAAAIAVEGSEWNLSYSIKLKWDWQT